MMPERLSAEDCRDRFVLIVGEVNTGKTKLTGKILESFVLRYAEDVAVLDLAPRLPHTSSHPAFRPDIGGRLIVPKSAFVHYFAPDLAAPRLLAASMQQRWELAEENAERIDTLFAHMAKAHIPHVFVNDVSLYLQARPVEKLMEWLSGFSTRVVNGYYGYSLGVDAFSLKERLRMEQLMRRCDRLVRF